MSRMQFVETVAVPLGVGGGLIPVSGVSAIPYIVNPDSTLGPQGQAYADRTSENPADTLLTDSAGTVSYYLDDGDYEIHISDPQAPPRIQPYVVAFRSNALVDDTPWTNLILNSGWTALTGAYTPAARLFGDMVHFRGALTNTSGGSQGIGTTLATLPSILAPDKVAYPTFGWNGTKSAALITVSKAGVITVQNSISNGDALYLDGAAFAQV